MVAGPDQIHGHGVQSGPTRLGGTAQSCSAVGHRPRPATLLLLTPRRAHQPRPGGGQTLPLGPRLPIDEQAGDGIRRPPLFLGKPARAGVVRPPTGVGTTPAFLQGSATARGRSRSRLYPGQSSGGSPWELTPTSRTTRPTAACSPAPALLSACPRLNRHGLARHWPARPRTGRIGPAGLIQCPLFSVQSHNRHSRLPLSRHTPLTAGDRSPDSG